MPQLQFNHIINKDKGKTGFVLGLGPSLKTTLPDIQRIHYDKSNYKIISCNNVDLMVPDLNFDYWMLAQPADFSNPLYIRNAWRRYNSRPHTTFLYTDCLDLTPRELVKQCLTIDYIGYDQRHWKGEHCTWGKGQDGRHICCAGIISERSCIQEVFQQVTGLDHHYGAGDTVGVHMIALAVILGLNPIYVSGIDLDYTNGYVNNDLDINDNVDNRIRLGASVMKDQSVVDRILEDIRIIRDGAANIGIEIYDMNGNGRISSVLKHKKFEI